MKMKVVSGKVSVKSAIATWRNAFRVHGTGVDGLAPSALWVEDVGVWLDVRGPFNGKEKYWNGLGTVLGDKSTGDLLVEVNPPPAGTPPGRFQGVVAIDDDSRFWILHRGELNVDFRRVFMQKHAAVVAGVGLKAVDVAYPDGTVLSCYPVACLGSDTRTVVAETKKFADACQIIRSHVIYGKEASEVQRLARFFEEASGTYSVGEKSVRQVRRLHAVITNALAAELEARAISVANVRVGSLGPDIYSIGEGERMLFEIKIGNGSSDILKGVGQLFVYEKVLKGAYRKFLVLPETLRQEYREVVAELGIELVEYRHSEKTVTFAFPASFL
ncbi:hypothetical protein C8J31_11429 [Rhizobium sp. PP-CC-2G-626]|nr:hypothetical protein C8J31_11429 [Rhizobium sp. PP-CC-2G-626]